MNKMRARLRKKLEKQGRLPKSEQPVNKKVPFYLREDATMSKMYKDLQSLNSNHPLLALASISNGALQFNPEFYTQHPEISENYEMSNQLLFGRATIRYSLELSDALKQIGKPGLEGYRKIKE